MKISEIIRLPEQDGWVLKAHGRIAPALLPPSQAWAICRRRQTGRYLEAEDRIEHPEAGRFAKGPIVKGYVVVFDGDDEAG
jgi:hypothetical protein